MTNHGSDHRWLGHAQGVRWSCVECAPNDLQMTCIFDIVSLGLKDLKVKILVWLHD